MGTTASLLSNRREILRRLAPGNLIQPATVLWRVYEIEAVQNHVMFEGRVLDLGCGDGSLSRVIFGEDAGRCDLVGLEPDPSDVADARQSGLYSLVHEAHGDAIPEPAAAFDMAFSNSVLEHIPVLEPVLADVSRVLKPGGRFVLTVPSEQFHDCLAGGMLIEALVRRRGDTAASAIDRRLQHHRYWSLDEWRAKLGAVGLDLTFSHRYFPKDAVQAWETISNWTGGLAFELFQRKNETRALQRKMKLDVLDSLVPANARVQLLEWILGKNLRAAPQSSGEPSGGLLVIATRR